MPVELFSFENGAACWSEILPNTVTKLNNYLNCL
jgi:hypothetical protein